MPLTVGDRLGHYEVTALIGEVGWTPRAGARHAALSRRLSTLGKQ